ncbi:hypothetical protein FE784_07060 [Paenibacillus hemerocallicola]|uniref:Glycosyl hydrolases family 39 N-terminal catalytic domain-containing protein n=2 Tax=Paenibacillus hemerocallicola TaxID=1172614 RepID=A0A5C4TCZ8_9BACL|nr:hypothetical protein FE784_07060 [Paenibacillus hemerocallicola]
MKMASMSPKTERAPCKPSSRKSSVCNRNRHRKEVPALMADIILHPELTLPPLKRLHGVNNGPVCYGSLLDVTPYYEKAGFPLIRLHDTNWPNPGEVDIHTIFRDFSRDADDPASYDFSRTDEYIRSVLATGAKIVYRLGESIEHTKVKYYVHPPADMEKWARICVNIIRHYNEGWADGFHYGIRYWEIWNEPDNPDRNCMWSGTPEQYYEMYRIAATAIKRHDPALKVGGQAATMVNLPFTEGFVAYCRDNRLPLDFFTWHTYADEPGQIMRNALKARKLLDEAGFEDTESHLNEWNYMRADEGTEAELWGRLWKPGGETFRRSLFERQKNEEGASFAAAVFAMLQDAPIDEANYYDGQPHELFSGLFDAYGIPQKTYRVFEQFQLMCAYGKRVGLAIGESAAGLYGFGVSSDDGAEMAMWISNFCGESRQYSIEVVGGGGSAAHAAGTSWRTECRLLDAERNFDSPAVIAGEDGAVEVFLPRHSVMVLRWKRF